MKMSQIQSVQKLGDIGVPAPEIVEASQSLILQSSQNKYAANQGVSIQSQSLSQIRDISPLTHKQLNALSPNQSQISLTQKKKNHRIPCPAHQEFDISNMCTAEGCLEPLCAECIRIHTQLHNNEGTSSNIDTIYNKRDQCSEILKEQINIFNQERAVLSQIGNEIRDNIQKQSLEQIQKAREKVQYIVDSYFKQIEESVKEKAQLIKSSPNIEHQKVLDNKIQLIITDIYKMENQLSSTEFINSIIQILSGEFDHNYEKIQAEINDVVEKSAQELFEVEFDEQKLYSVNMELTKLLFVKPSSLGGLLNKTLELSRIDYVQTRFESPLKKHNQSVLTHIATSQTKQVLTTHSNNNSQSMMFALINNIKSQPNDPQNQQNSLNTEQQYGDTKRMKAFSSQKNPQLQLQRNLSAMINSSQVAAKVNNDQSLSNNQSGLDQFLHIPKSQRSFQQKQSNNQGNGLNQGKELSLVSSIQPSLNLSRDTSPNRNSAVSQDKFNAGRSSLQKSNQRQQYEQNQRQQYEDTAGKKVYTFNEVTSVGQNTDREAQNQLKNNSQFNMRQNNHLMRQSKDNSQPHTNKSQENIFYYGQQNQASQRPSVSHQGEESISQSINLEQSQQGIQRQMQINIGDYFSPQCARKFLHFFQDNSKILHYIDLETLSKDPSSQVFQQQILNIQFKIPMYHRSIMTPYGDAFITGGVDVNQKSYVLNSCYKLNYRQATLEPISSMYYPRSNHGIAFCAGFIYVVGGSTNQDNSSLDKCERYDVEIGRWEQISSLNQKCIGCSLSQFSNRYLFKFGGNADMFTVSNTIERYDIMQNEWKIIPFNVIPNQITMKLPSYTGACQINNDEIILLGGSNHNNRLSNVIIVKMYSQECDVILAKPLPRGGTFWANPFVLGGVLFGLQNINMDKSPEHCYFGKKRILAFNSSLWKQIGSDDIEYYNSSNTSSMLSFNNQSQIKSQLFNGNHRQVTSSKSPFRGGVGGGGSNLKSSSELKRAFYE